MSIVSLALVSRADCSGLDSSIPGALLLSLLPTMLFSLPKSVRCKRPAQPSSSPARWTNPSPERPPYGSSQAQVFPRVDVRTPFGRYKQWDPKARRRSPGSLPTKLLTLEGRRPASPQKRDHRLAQWEKWTSEVIPSLVPIFLNLLRRSNNLKDVDRTLQPCGCQPTVRKRSITLVSPQGM